jgi:uncharacterized protein (TIGR03437 family)
LQPTSAGIKTDFQATIAVGSTPSDLSVVSGALAITVNFYAQVPANRDPDLGLVTCDADCTYPAGGITDSDIIVNPAYSFSTTGTPGTTDLQSTMTHELGHSLGANHVGLIGATMYPRHFANVQRFLTTDDVDFVNSAYPAIVPMGTIGGTITGAGGVGISYGMFTLIDSSSGETVGGLSNSDGTFSIQVPPGTYVIYAEPYNTFIQPGNFSLSTTQAATVSTFQSTIFGGSKSPTPITVTANGTATVNIAVTAGTTPLQLQYYAFGGAGKSGDVTSVTPLTGPVQVPSGASIDFAFIGNGLGSTLTDANFQMYGQGISVRPGTVRADKSVTLPQGTLIRATLDIPARQTNSMVSIFITDANGSTISLSAILTVTPPTPTFVSKGVVSAGSYLGSPNGDGAVSPGGLYSVFDLPNTPNLGPAGFVQNGPYDSYGNLATILGGVSVTFDGIPAPMFLSFGGQLNFQAPFELAGKTSTQMAVNYLGSASAPVTVPVLAVQPALFTSCIDGKTLCAINLNDHTFNSASNPAAKGDYVEVYGTGVGQTSAYTVLTGIGAPAPSAGFTGNYTYSIGGSAAAPALFGGWTPTAVGLAQWDLQIPANSATGAVPISVTAPSGGASQPAVTIFVK